VVARKMGEDEEVDEDGCEVVDEWGWEEVEECGIEGSREGEEESLGSRMGGRSLRRSSNVVFNESRRFCSAAL